MEYRNERREKLAISATCANTHIPIDENSFDARFNWNVAFRMSQKLKIVTDTAFSKINTCNVPGKTEIAQRTENSTFFEMI